MYKTLKAPLNAQVELTTGCTHACLHCYNYWRAAAPRSQRHAPRLDPDRVRQVIRKLAAAEIFEVTFTGGEPLLNWDALLIGLEECQAAGILTSLNSNLVPATRRRLAELRDRGLKHILTSILGPTAAVHDEIASKKGAFNAVARNIAVARDLGIKISANMVVSRINASHVIATARLASQLGVSRFAATKAGHPGGDVDFASSELDSSGLEQLLRDLSDVKKTLAIAIDVMEPIPTCAMRSVPIEPEYVRRKCAAGVTTFTIGADGGIRPCSHLDEVCGNVFADSIANVWHNMLPWRDGSLLPGECVACPSLRHCGGGCRMEAKMRNGTFRSLDPFAQPGDVTDVALRSGQARRLARRTPPTSTRFALARGFRARTEPFGATVFAPGGTYTFLSKAGWSVIAQLQDHTSYGIDDERIHWGAVDPCEFIPPLLNARVLSPN